MFCHDQKPVGVFDSGIGGLTVLAALLRRLPEEHLVYLGDTARVPYGTKSATVVRRYARNTARFLLQKGIKALVIGCNTASAVALDSLIEELPIPVVGVIEPGAMRVAERTRSKVVGVIGTEGTIASQAYVKAIKAIDPAIVVHQRACPLFVPLAEEGWGDHAVSRQVACEYLDQWSKNNGLDALILGCTHYPLLVPAISYAVGDQVELVDSATAVADRVAQMLDENGIRCRTKQIADAPALFVTDVPKRFQIVGERFLGQPLGEVGQVDLEV